MKRVLLIISLALLAVSAAQAQTKTWQVTETGWGRIEKTYVSILSPGEGVGEMNIPRWRKVSGTLTVDFDRKEAVLSLPRKKGKTFTLLTESKPYTTRDGWTYVDYKALDGSNSVCHFWLCKHESGAERILTLYPWTSPDTVYGYLLTPEE
ncbi:MAG: hypothetical protein K5910_04710 [Bacteroidales bacterium]|nr:hypothetical protein [Bacteroidales bacterium]